MPKVSVIIPIYNVEEYLRECLDSVINQTLKDIEIICINDCSPDNCSQILNEYANKDNRIKIINFEENKGIGYARNKGLEIATGEYIMLLDSDDWYELDACETAYNHITTSKDKIAFFSYKWFYNETFEERTYFKQLLKDRPYLYNVKLYNLDENYLCAYHWTGIYNREFLIENNIKYSHTSASEDTLFKIRGLTKAESITIINQTLICYRIIPKTRFFNIKSLKEIVCNFSECHNTILHSKYPQYFLKSYAAEYVPGIISKLKDYRDKDKFTDEERSAAFYLIRNFINLFNTKEQIKEIKKVIKYNSFRNIVNSNSYQEFERKEFLLEDIFSIKNVYKDDIKHKKITILGKKIIIKCKQN
ncbi:MAG: glycosyltransferase [Candidatus Gastranaerophilales bacterium]|nr:glycosyltransferase [Candidatus Gastranaerophilales bacterium]